MNWVRQIALPGLVLSISACASNPIVTKETRLSKNAEQVIGEFGYWKRDCSSRHFDIFIEQYPKSGDLRFEVGSLIIPEDPIVGASGKCVGQPVQSKRVIYIPFDDFTGTDFVSYVVKSSVFLGAKSYNVSIDIN